MSASSSSKRIKLDPSPSPSENDQNPRDTSDLEQEHCTICLQSFLDRTIIPVCAHEFCLECILLWSEQSRKCPLCSRSFDDSYLIHRIRSQYDYQKHYLPPMRSSPPPPLAREFRVNALRNTRRERQWGRRQRRQREEADQLERAIARRRWIYQYHLYAKHVASNPYTRYRPFPTPVQFAASPDLISRMTVFLRRELRVWPNLDVEFLTTYTISLMKSIDIRSESAVKLLSEFLDLDTPYTAGARHVNAEHFAHEIYTFLRSPYRDLNMYDQSAQYDTPPEIPPPREIERGSRWSAERSPSRSRSDSRYQSPVPHHENSAIHSLSTRHDRNSSAETRREDRPNHRHIPNLSPRGREDYGPRNHPSSRRHSPLGGVQGNLRNGHSDDRTSDPEASNSAMFAEGQGNNFRVQSHLRGDQNGIGQATENVEEIFVHINAPKMSVSRCDDPAAVPDAGEPSVTRLIDGPPEGTDDEVADYVDNVRGGSSANPQPSRKRSASVRVRPCNRTLSESVQAYLSRPAASRYPPKRPTVSGDERSTTDTRPELLLRLTDGPTGPDIGKFPSPWKTFVDDHSSTLSDDTAPRRSQPHVFSSNRASFAPVNHANTTAQSGNHVGGGETRPHRAGGNELSSAGPGLELPPPTRYTSVLVVEDAHSESVQVQPRMDGMLGRCAEVEGVVVSLDDQGGDHDCGDTTTDISPLPTDAGVPLVFQGIRRTTCNDDLEVGDTTTGPATRASGSKSIESPTDVVMSALETRLRARARVRARLVAIKCAGGASAVKSSASASNVG